MANPILITITYDKYTPNVETQIVRDFLMMQTACPQDKFICLCASTEPERALKAIGVMLGNIDQAEQSGTLIRYKVGEKYAPRPPVKFKSTIIDRDLMPKLGLNKENKLDLRQHPAYTLPNLSRPYVSNIHRLRPPANNGTVPPNPALIFLWGP